MAFELVSKLQNLWPFSARKFDDLRASNELVRELPIPERTKQFVYAVRDPETESVIYILSAQSLSERSAMDVQSLVDEIKPDAVVAQIGLSHGIELLAEEAKLEDGDKTPLPTSSFEVLRRCFMDKISKEKYEDVAGSLVLREIFGVGFHGYLLAAKKAAKEAGSSFLVIESPCLQSSAASDELDDKPLVDSDGDVMNKFHAFFSSFAPQNAFASGVTLSSRRYLFTTGMNSQMLKLLSLNVETAILSLTPSSSVPETESHLEEDYEAPTFAQSIYPLLQDLHNMFNEIPSLGKALSHAQKMLHDINEGEPVDRKIISEVHTFRIAVEGLRIALNNAGKLPIHKTRNPTVCYEFSELSTHEKSQLLFAQTLRAQTKKFKTTVAVIDANSLAGLRRFWNDPIPSEVENLVEQLCYNDTPSQTDRKSLLAGKPVVAVGAGATAVLGASWLSKAVPASTLMKIMTFKFPFSLKLGKTLALGKTLGPVKIRAVAHGVIASAEKTSVSAMRTAFYEIMRKRGAVQAVGVVPWATFGLSVVTCSGLVMYGDGIECVAESLPSAPSIASLGRGVERLRAVSRDLRRSDGTGIHAAIESLTSRLNLKKA